MLRAIWGRVQRKVGDVARRYNPIRGIHGANIGGNFIPLQGGLIDPVDLRRRQARPSRPNQAPPNQTAAPTRNAQQYAEPIGPQPFDPIDADVRAFKGMRETYRARRQANQGWFASGYGAAADFFTAKDLPEALRGAARWRRGIAAGTAGLVGIGIGTRALDAAFNRRRY